MVDLKQIFKRAMAQKQDTLLALPGVLGDAAGAVVVEGVPNAVYARVAGDLLQVLNYRVANQPELPVWVGYDPLQPDVLQVLGYRFMDDTAGGGDLAVVQHHGQTHGILEPDMIEIALQQFTPLRVWPDDTLAMTINVEQGFLYIGEVWTYIAAQSIDLNFYTPGTAGYEVWVLITLNGSGTAVATAGTAAAGPIALSAIPDAPADSAATLAAVRLYTGQTEIGINRAGSDIVDLRWPGSSVTDGTKFTYLKLDASNGPITGQLGSNVATGTAPFAVASTTLVTNLNADLLDGYHAADLVQPRCEILQDSDGAILTDANNEIIYVEVV